MRDTPLERTLLAAKALANPARLRLLGLLETGECCVCQLTAVLGLAASTISAHLSDLKQADLAVERREGKIVFYRLAEESQALPLRTAALDAIRGDEQTTADRALLSRFRSVPYEVFCAAGTEFRKLPAFRGDPLVQGRKRGATRRS